MEKPNPIGGPSSRPTCLCCGQSIDTELCLDLRGIYVPGQLCELCMSRHTRYTQDLVTGQ